MSEKYVCSYCGAEYDSPKARARCELECDEKITLERERQRQRELEDVREARLAEIQEAEKRLRELIKAYQSDYKTKISWNRGRDQALFDLLFQPIFDHDFGLPDRKVW